MKPSSADRESHRLLGVVTAVVIIATLYFARVVFIPLALAGLFSLLLTPVVTFLEKLKLPRSLAILLVVAALVGMFSFAVWRASQEFVDLTARLPAYGTTLHAKIESIKGSGSQSLHAASDAMKELGKEIANSAPGQTAGGESKKASSLQGASASKPLAVEVVTPTNVLESAENMLGPLATAGVVTIFTIFILVGREDLRDRLIELAGGRRLKAVTQALDDATYRINRYLFLQLLVNSAYGIVIGSALYLIGIPNAALWGLSAGLLRFLPYVGPPLAALMPVLLSLAVFTGWHQAVATAGVYLVLEILVANFVEPLLYSTHIGISPLAILVAAVFWTLIWGLPGLVLSTPLTVCLVVMGRYIPALSFLDTIFGDAPALSAQAQYYQRLLATNQSEARQVLEQSLKEKSLEELYSSVVIPALSLAEQDRHRNELDEATQDYIFQSTRELIEELGIALPESAGLPASESTSITVTAGTEPARKFHILCLPARDDADEVVAMMLSQLLEKRGYFSESLPVVPTAEMLQFVAESKPDFICISALPPFAIDRARSLYSGLRVKFPNLPIAICLWHFEGDRGKAFARLKLAANHGLLLTLPEILEHVEVHVGSLAKQ